jgi:hypothetical protein
MGGGADVDTLPSGMTFEEPSESPHSSDDSNGIDFSADDYDE